MANGEQNRWKRFRSKGQQWIAKFSGEANSDPELEQRFDQYIQQYQRFTAAFAVFGWLFILFLVEMMKLPNYAMFCRPVCLLFIAISSILLVLPKFFDQKRSLELITIGAISSAALLAGYVYFSFEYLIGPDLSLAKMVDGELLISYEKLPSLYDLHDTVTSQVVFPVAALLNTIFIPLRGRNAYIIPLIFILLGVVAYSSAIGSWELFVAVSVGLGTILRVTNMKFKREELKQTLLNEKLLSQQAEAKHAHEMKLARNIQMSMKADEDVVVCGHRVRSFLKPSKQVGGDWAALRTSDNNDLIAMVVDSTGHGMHAALVTHAVQSLWARELSNASFDPEKWLKTVNTTLWRMGKHSPHTATIGIVQMKDDIVNYWSTGHCPIFVFGETEDRIYSEQYGHGNILGLSRDLEIRNKSFEVPGSESFRILLSSDGVFETMPRAIKKRKQFLESLDQNFEEILNEMANNDDMTAVLIYNDRGSEKNIGNEEVDPNPAVA